MSVKTSDEREKEWIVEFLIMLGGCVGLIWGRR